MNALREPETDTVDVRIIRMRRRHLRAIMRIENQVYPRPWTIGVFTSELLARDRCYVVAKVGSTLVGYGGMLCSLDDAHITNVAVDPAWHRHKIGTRLLAALAQQARAEGRKNLTLEVRVSNKAAQAMYQRFGFAPAGIRQRYYEGVEDAIVMWAHDIDSPAYGERLRDLLADVPGTTVSDL